MAPHYREYNLVKLTLAKFTDINSVENSVFKDSGSILNILVPEHRIKSS